MSKPALSVLLPVYNGERFLAEAIESILGQTFADFEFIIINDGSRDGSGGIIDDFAARDARIRAFHQENRGLVDTLNRGIALARAPLIARMDADDISLPRRFELQVTRFKNRPELAVVGGFINVMDSDGQHLRIGDYPIRGNAVIKFLERSPPVAHPAVIMRKSAVEAVGGYRSLMKHVEDYDLWQRLSEAGFLIENIPEIVLNYRFHNESVSVKHRAQQALLTVIARVAHHVRKNGLNDPLANISEITESTIELFPEECRSYFEAGLFELRYNTISLKNSQEIEQALRELGRLSPIVQREDWIIHFLLRAAGGSWRNRRYATAVSCFSRATVRNPALVSMLSAAKMFRLGRRVLFRPPR